jgi:N-methylhydantoinase A
VIELRRQDRPNLYDLAVELSEPLVAAVDRFGVTERMTADGSVATPLQDLDTVLDRVASSGVRSLAVALLHSYANPAHEQQIKERVNARFPGMYVTLSSEISL